MLLFTARNMPNVIGLKIDELVLIRIELYLHTTELLYTLTMNIKTV